MYGEFVLAIICTVLIFIVWLRTPRDERPKIPPYLRVYVYVGAAMVCTTGLVALGVLMVHVVEPLT